MPNRSTHLAIATVAGAAASAATVASRRQRRPDRPHRPLHDLAQITGGAVGGRCTGRLPDIIEPAVHPNHRGPAHSVAAATGAGRLAFLEPVRAWEDDWRDRAERLAVKREEAWAAFRDAKGVADAAWHFLIAAGCFLGELVCALVAGLPVGAAAGYVSHVVADASTPKSVPLLGLRS